MASSRRPRLYHSSARAAARRPRAAGRRRRLRQRQEREERRDLLPAVPLQGPAADRSPPRPTALHYGQSFTVDTPDASQDREGLARPHGLGDAQRRHGPALHEPLNDDGHRRRRARSTGRRTPTWRRPAGTWCSWSTTTACRRMGQIVQVDSAGDTQRADRADRRSPRPPRTDGANLNWSAATDNVGVDRVPRVPLARRRASRRRAANRIARVKTGTTYTDRGVAAGTYYYRVRAVDKAGNLEPGLDRRRRPWSPATRRRRRCRSPRPPNGATRRGTRRRDRDRGRQRRRRRASSSSSTARTSAAPTPLRRTRSPGTRRRRPTAGTR